MENRERLIRAIESFRTQYRDEAAFIPVFLELLSHPRAFHRDHLPGHMTGSAWIIDESKQFALLTHHAKLSRWLQPGGHADGDENIINVCTKEAVEETGLTSLKLVSSEIFDLDIHTIPARKDFPEHDHYDVRLLFSANKNEPFHVSEESHDLQWVPLRDLKEKTSNNLSMIRMAEKVATLL